MSHRRNVNATSTFDRHAARRNTPNSSPTARATGVARRLQNGANEA
jgi:hypothetical protein